MNSILRKHLIGIGFGLTMLFGVLSLSSPVYSEQSNSSRYDLEVALEKAVKCEPGALNDFNGSITGTGTDFQRKMKSLGVRVASESKHGGEITYQFPRGTRVFGYDAISAIYFDESTTIFFVRLNSGLAGLRDISNSLRLHPIKDGNAEGYGYFGEFDVRFLRKIAGGASPPDTVIGGIGRKDGRSFIAIGCQNLSW